MIAHQPGRIVFEDGAVRGEGELFSHYHGAFFMIDSGMSRGVASGHGALLHVATADGHVMATARDGEGHETLLWKE